MSNVCGGTAQELDLDGPDSPAVGTLISHASKQRDAVLNGGAQQRVVQLTDFTHPGN